MPFCPECKYEYVPGVTTCPDCRVALVDQLVEEVKPDLVTVAQCQFEIEAEEARIKLESYGIKCVLTNDVPAEVGLGLGFGEIGVRVLVDKADAEKALEILAKEDDVPQEEAEATASEAE